MLEYSARALSLALELPSDTILYITEADHCPSGDGMNGWHYDLLRPDYHHKSDPIEYTSILSERGGGSIPLC
jgi:hypothetical protein